MAPDRNHLSARSHPSRRSIPTVDAVPGLLVEVASSDFAGRITGVTPGEVELTDRRGRTRRFELHPGAFLVDDVRVTLVAPEAARPSGDPAAAVISTPSGSLAAPRGPVRVARAARILVEGIHDAEIVERIWGDDLRHEGVVVEVLGGVDALPAAVQAFGPGPGRRLGVLVDHLVPGSKEHRIATAVTHPDVLVTGHPFVDVWEAVRPEALGLDGWPRVELGVPWKEGVASALGYAEPGDVWRLILSRLDDYRQLDRRLVGAVERLIDFVTAPRAG